jgi:hypothetical protein
MAAALFDYYDGLARELLAKLRRLSVFTGHGPSIGTTHEEFVREAVQPLLSRRFSLRTGFLYAGDGVASPQCDIIVVDEGDPSPYLYKLGNLVVVQPRAVALVIEVKTRLDRSTFHEATKSLRRCLEVSKAAKPPGVFPTMLFAYEGPALTPSTLHDWYSTADIPDDVISYPWMVYVLTRGALDLLAKVPCHRFFVGEEDEEVKVRTLSLFLGIVRKALEFKADVESDPFALFSITEGLKWSDMGLRFGVGLAALPVQYSSGSRTPQDGVP